MEQELLPKPETDLPTPEKEIPEHVAPASQGETLRSYRGKFPFPKYVFLGIVFVILLSLIGGAYFFGKNSSGQQIGCTQEAKLCPDGSSVGRTGPKCEFAKCPTVIPTPDPTVDWKTYTNGEFGFSVKYPKEWSPQSRPSSATYLFHVNLGEKIDPNNDYFPGTADLTISIFQPSYYMGGEGSNREDLTKNTDLIHFVRAMNGLVPQSNFAGAKQRTKTIDGIVAISYTWGGTGETGYYLKHNGNIYEFVYNSSLSKNKKEADQSDENRFNKILSTFKFTDSFSVTPTLTNGVVCTQDAMQCPDGTWVGRTGPNCEFAPCLP